MIITLTGFMGCGKSTAGNLVRKATGCEFIDLDQLIEQRCGRKIPEIFATDGEAAFRRYEQEALEAVIDGHEGKDLLLSLGGGTVMTASCAKLVKEKTRCIYLRATVETLERHLSDDRSGRPMLRQHGIAELMELRGPIYESVASVVLDIDGKTPEEVAAELLESLNPLSGGR